MEVKMFYKTQREVAEVINQIIDAYWDNDINEEIMINEVGKLYTNNNSKIIKDNDFTAILKQQCGKRRLEVVERILHMISEQKEVDYE